MKRNISILLTLMIVAVSSPTYLFAATSPRAIVIAASDFQDVDKDSDRVERTNRILSRIKASKYGKASHFLLVGDVNGKSITLPASNVNTQIRTLKSTVKKTFTSFTDKNITITQGNHEASPGIYYSKSGVHDRTYFGLYVINEDEFPNPDATFSKSKAKAVVQSTAGRLKTYLNNKIKAKYTKPILIACHVPLHFTTRTIKNECSLYGDMIFNVLDQGAKAGLNIIFLYGHNHRDGYEDHLGGAAVFFKPGDTLNLADYNKFAVTTSKETAYKTRKLNFYYMNAGYISRYLSASTCDRTSTMTTMAIYDNTVVFSRFDQNGFHNLKSIGLATNSYNAFLSSSKSYGSSYTATLRKSISSTLIR